MANFDNFNAALAELQAALQRLITDFQSNGGDQALVDQARAALVQLTESINTTDPSH